MAVDTDPESETDEPETEESTSNLNASGSDGDLEVNEYSSGSAEVSVLNNKLQAKNKDILCYLGNR